MRRQREKPSVAGILRKGEKMITEITPESLWFGKTNVRGVATLLFTPPVSKNLTPGDFGQLELISKRTDFLDNH